MLIFSDQKQDLTGLNKREKLLIKYIRTMSEIKVPNDTDVVNHREYPDYMLYPLGIYHGNYLKIHHQKFNNNYSISILLKVNAYFIRYDYKTMANCWAFNNEYYDIKFRLKEGIQQDFTLHDDIGSANRLLDIRDFYDKFFVDIERKSFLSI